MKHKNYLLGFVLAAIVCCSCAHSSIGNLVGSDRDEHGCIGSAGYTWSYALHSCVRLWEAGTRFDAGPEQVFLIYSADSTFAEIFRQAASRYFANGLRARMCGNRARDTKKCRYKTALLASRWTIIIIPGLTTDTTHCSPQLKAQAPTRANRIGPLLVLVWFVWKRTSDVRTTTMGYKMKQHAPHGEHCLSSFT